MWDDPPTARELYGFTVEVACGSCHAREGLVGLEATNANAMVAATTGGPPVFSTNPIAFGFPLGEETRRRERIVRRFKSCRHLQRFVSIHDPIANLFHIPRHDISSNHHRELRTAAMQMWNDIAQLAHA
jgi:hypothetical protein